MSLLLLGAGNSGASPLLMKFTAGDTPAGMLFTAPTSGKNGGTAAPVRLYVGDSASDPRSTYAGFSVMTGATFNLVIFGDSITRGYVGTPSTYGTTPDSWPAKVARALAASGKKFNFANFGRDSARLSYGTDTTLDLPTIAAATVPSGLSSLPTVIVVFAGTNDVALDSATGATIWTRLKTLCAALKVSYPTNKVVVVTMLPRANNGTIETARGIYNGASGIRGGDVSFDYVADAGGDATFAANAASSTNTTYYTDQVHGTDTLYKAIAGTYVLPKVQDAMTALGV